MLDFIIHGMILEPVYERTASLWRPEDEMKMGLMFFVTLVASFCFVFIYSRFFAQKGIKICLQYGLIFGLSVGMVMGYGTYAFMPIPYSLALGWFLATIVETAVGGLLTGWIIKE